MVPALKRWEESTRARASEEEVEIVGRRIDSASSERGTVATGGLWCGNTPEGWRLVRLEKGDEGR
jgi:hypothetical protein